MEQLGGFLNRSRMRSRNGQQQSDGRILAGAREAEAPQCLVHLRRLARIKLASQWLGTLISPTEP